MYSKLKFDPKEESAYHLMEQELQMQNNRIQARKVIIEALRMQKLARQKERNNLTYEFQKREFFSTINDYRITNMMYSY